MVRWVIKRHRTKPCVSRRTVVRDYDVGGSRGGPLDVSRVLRVRLVYNEFDHRRKPSAKYWTSQRGSYSVTVHPRLL